MDLSSFEWANKRNDYGFYWEKEMRKGETVFLSFWTTANKSVVETERR